MTSIIIEEKSISEKCIGIVCLDSETKLPYISYSDKRVDLS